MSKPTTSPYPERDRKRYEQQISRKSFLKFAGISATTVTLAGMYGCDSTSMTNGIAGETDASPGTPTSADTVNLGSGDIGVLNLAYTLEQLDSTFLTRALENPYEGITDEERHILEAMRNHEVAHREFFRTVLGSDAIPELELNFNSVDFNSRSDVLETMKMFEDIGISAYNGSGQLIEDPELLLIAGKIVSVEARHVAVVRDLLDPRSASFAGDDVVNEMGLDIVNTPDDVITAVSDFIRDELDASNLPQPANN